MEGELSAAPKRRINQGTLSLIGICLLVVLTFASLMLELQHNENTEQPVKTSPFELLHPTVAHMDVEEFLETKKTLSVSLKDLRAQVLVALEPYDEQRYGIYIEDLTTGAWLGFNERDTFVPASLIKLPVVIAIFKKLELGELTLDTNIRVQEEDIDTDFGKGVLEPGDDASIMSLVKLTLHESDNTAANVLLRQLTPQEVDQAFVASGLPLPDNNNIMQSVSPKDYANILRSLYVSSYLRRQFSQLLLSNMVDGSFNGAITAGLAADVKFAHKFGVNTPVQTLLDCGIAYLPSKPYMICIMSQGAASARDASMMMKDVSQVAYEYFAAKLQHS